MLDECYNVTDIYLRRSFPNPSPGYLSGMNLHDAIERGRRVVENRKRDGLSVDSPLVRVSGKDSLSHSITKSCDFSHPQTRHISWTEYSLKAEIDTLKCVNESKEEELSILRKQLADTNRLLERAMEQIAETESQRSMPHPTNQAVRHSWQSSQSLTEVIDTNFVHPVVSYEPTCRLLTSFTLSSMAKLEQVFSRIESSLKVSDISAIPPTLDRLLKREKQYTELFEAVCHNFTISSREETHASIMQRIREKQPLSGTVTFTKDRMVQSGRSVAWTLPR